MSRKRILIFSTDSFLGYQPSILNLYDELAKHFDTHIISYQYFNNFVPVKASINLTYIKPSKLIKKFLFMINIIMNKFIVPVVRLFNKNYEYQNDLFKAYKVWLGKKHLRNLSVQPDEVIAVDYIALYTAQQIFGAVHLQSLEIYLNDKYKKKIDPDKIKTVIVPSEERYEYNFGSRQYKKFIIPNAPAYKEYDTYPINERKGLIWAGTISQAFGTYHVIEFIKAYPEYTLTLKGSFVSGYEAVIREKYADLISEGRLIINTEYLDNDAFIHFISKHLIGFCFYEWDVIKNNINYYLAPAGRLFMYYAAGVPTIACKTPGLKSINDFNAGQMITDYKLETIKKAVDTIMADYANMSANSIKAAIFHSFETNTLPLIEYLKTH